MNGGGHDVRRVQCGISIEYTYIGEPQAQEEKGEGVWHLMVHLYAVAVEKCH